MSGYLMALTAVFFWSINIIIASYFATTLEPFEIAFGRWFIACLILVPMAWSGLKRNFRLLADNWLLVVSLAITALCWTTRLSTMPDGRPQPSTWGCWT